MISVCLAAYNGENYIKEQIDSILCQLGNDDELIVSDDGSTDKTIAILKQYGDARIKILYNKNRHGVIGNFENALQNARGDYIFFADQDDVWLKNKVSDCLPYLQEFDIIVSDCIVVDAALNEIHASFFQKNKSLPGIFHNLKHNSYLGCCMAFRKDILKICLPFPKKIPMHDLWIGFVAELFYSSCFIPQKLSLYRRHGSNISPTSQSSHFGLVKKISFRWNLIKYIPLLIFRKMKKLLLFLYL